MKKDYIPVTGTDAHLDETAFVEEFWSKIWDGRQLDAAAAARVERQPEFPFVDRYLRTLPAGSRILDGGCGVGEWTLYYTAEGHHVVGLDLSVRAIERLQRTYPGHEFVVGDIRKTAFPDRSFDAYFSWGTFEHFEEGLGACFDEAYRILKPGGLLVISLPFQNANHLRRDRRPLEHWDEAFEQDRGYLAPMRFYQWRLTKEELRREFEVHRFQALEVRPIHKGTGVSRAVQHDLHVPLNSRWNRWLSMGLYALLPTSYIAHILIGAGRRR